MGGVLTSLLASPDGRGDGRGPWFLVFPLFWLIIMLLAAVWPGRRGVPWRQPSIGRSVLAERYARGDISADEYRERLSVSTGDDR
jgi:putative membrane protein